MNKLTLWQKINAIRKDIKVDKEQSNQGYKSFTINKLNAELNAFLCKYDLSVRMNTEELRVEPITKANGAINFLVQGIAQYEIIDNENNTRETVSIPLIGLNQASDPSKSLGNACSYSYKYLWITLLGLTDETTDVDSSHYDNQASMQEQIDQSIDAGNKPKDKDESKDLLEKYTKGVEQCNENPTTEAGKAKVIEWITKARKDFLQDKARMSSYHQTKVKNAIKELKETWEILDD